MADQATIVQLSAGTITTAPLSAQQQTLRDAEVALLSALLTDSLNRDGTRLQHAQALASLRPALTANATTIANDLAALQTTAAALQAGTQPTAAQVLQILRLILRVLAIQAAG